MSLSYIIAIIAAVIAVVSANGTLYPRNIHVAYGDNTSGSAVVSWTASNVHGIYYEPFVSYGLKDVTEHSAALNDCKKVSYQPAETHYHCSLKYTKHDTRYLYQINTGTKYASAILSFKTGPKVGDFSKFAIVGDLGVENAQGTLAALSYGLKNNLFSGALHAGDIAYADDHDLEGENAGYEDEMNNFFELIQPFAAQCPYMVAVGNHDVTCKITTDELCAPYLTNFTAYNSRWAMPSKSSGGVMNLWYSFDHGNVHYVVINTESDIPSAPYNPHSGTVRAGGFGNQREWLIKDLKKANEKSARKVTPWLVVIGHRPIYSTSTLDYPMDQESRTQKDLEPLFKEYNVDMYVSGHVHLYERTYPIYNNKTAQENYEFPSATTYIINGAGGNLEGHCDHVVDELPDHMPYRNGEMYGYGIISTQNGRFKEGDRVNSIGDFLGENRGPNTPPSKEVQDAYFNRLTKLTNANKSPHYTPIEGSLRAMLGLNDLFDEPIDKNTNDCKKVRSMCYSFMPAFETDKHVDRICITKCDD